MFAWMPHSIALELPTVNQSASNLLNATSDLSPSGFMGAETPPSVHISITDNSDGSYLALYTLTVAGNYVITVRMNQQLALGSTRQVIGKPARASSEATSGLLLVKVDGKLTPSGPEASTATAGVVGSFLFLARDEFFNPLTNGGDYFDVQLTGPSAVNSNPPSVLPCHVRGWKCSV